MGKQRKKQSRSRPQPAAVSEDPPSRWYYSLIRPLPLAMACAVISFALYFNTHSNRWAFDDFVAIVKNHDVTGTTPLSDLLRHDFWGDVLASSGSNKSFRPLTVLTFRVNASMHGIDPTMFHIWNNIFNAISAFCAVWTINSVRGLSEVDSKSRKEQVNFFLLISSLLFVFHPVHTEAVASVVGRAELLGALLAFGAFFCHQRCMQVAAAEQKAADHTARGKSKHGAVLFFVTLVLSFASALAKETGITVLAICGANEIACFWLPATFVPPKDPESRSTVRRQLPKSIMRFVALALVGVLYLAIRAVINGESKGIKPSFEDNPLIFAPNGTSYLLTALLIQALYMWRLIYPLTLLCDYGFNVIPLVEGLDDPRNIFILLWAGGLVLLVWMGIRDAREKRDPRPLVALSWIVAPLLPASHILTLGTVLAERLLFMPSLGYSMVVGLVFERLMSWTNRKVPPASDEMGKLGAKSESRPAFLHVFGIILTVFAVKVVSRNKEWHDDYTLFAADYVTHPQNLKIARSQAQHLLNEGDAEGAWKVANENYKRYENDKGNLAVLAKATALSDAGNHDFEKAYILLDKAQKLVEERIQGGKMPQLNDSTIYAARGYLLSKQGRNKEATPYFEEAAHMGSIVDPLNPKPRCNVGENLASLGSWAESVPHLEKCLELERAGGQGPSSYVDSIGNLGKAYLMTSRFDKAEEMFVETLNVRHTEDIADLLEKTRKLRKQREEREES